MSLGNREQLNSTRLSCNGVLGQQLLHDLPPEIQLGNEISERDVAHWFLMTGVSAEKHDNLAPH